MLFLPFATVAVVGLLASSPALAQYLNPTPPDHYVPSVSAPQPAPAPAPASQSMTQAAPSSGSAYESGGYPIPGYSVGGSYDPGYTPPPPPPPAPAYTPPAPVQAPNPNVEFNTPAFGGSIPPAKAPYSAQDDQGTRGSGDFISGGVGGGDQEYMRSIEKDYTLKVLFAGKNGDYLAIVNVTITDKQGNTLYNQATDGPILLARLKPGTYKIHAELEGQSANTTVTVGKNLRSIIIRL